MSAELTDDWRDFKPLSAPEAFRYRQTLYIAAAHFGFRTRMGADGAIYMPVRRDFSCGSLFRKRRMDVRRPRMGRLKSWRDWEGKKRFFFPAREGFHHKRSV